MGPDAVQRPLIYLRGRTPQTGPGPGTNTSALVVDEGSFLCDGPSDPVVKKSEAHV